MMIRFPIDCPADCPYLHGWDMSIDDLTFVCDKLNLQIDGCDMAIMPLPFCPIEKEDG